MNLSADIVNKLLEEFESLLYKTMHRLHITPNQSNYDDYFQELQIKLITIYQTFDGNPLSVIEDRYRFTAYAGKGLYWHGLYLFRKDNSLLNEVNTMEIAETLQNQEDNILEKNSELFISDFLNHAKNRLVEQDYLLLLYLVEGKRTVKEMARLMNVTRDTIYQRKNKIQEQLFNLKECLMD